MLKDDGAFESGKRGSIATIGSPSVSQTTLFDLEMQKLKSDEEKCDTMRCFVFPDLSVTRAVVQATCPPSVQ